jgi:hypothetical protein
VRTSAEDNIIAINLNRNIPRDRPFEGEIIDNAKQWKRKKGTHHLAGLLRLTTDVVIENLHSILTYSIWNGPTTLQNEIQYLLLDV